MVCLLMAGSVQAQGFGVGSPVQAKHLMDQAVAYVKAQGEATALKEFSRPNGKFQQRDLYVFALRRPGRRRGHSDPALIGQNSMTYRTPRASASTEGSRISRTAAVQNHLLREGGESDCLLGAYLP